MTTAAKVLYLFLAMTMFQPAASALQADAPNPAREKFQDDMKTAVMNGSITVAQVKELKANADTLKSVRENQTQQYVSVCGGCLSWLSLAAPQNPKTPLI